MDQTRNMRWGWCTLSQLHFISLLNLNIPVQLLRFNFPGFVFILLACPRHWRRKLFTGSIEKRKKPRIVWSIRHFVCGFQNSSILTLKRFYLTERFIAWIPGGRIFMQQEMVSALEKIDLVRMRRKLHPVFYERISYRIPQR